LSNSDLYLTISKPSEGLFKDKGSKFLAFAFPVENEGQIKVELESLRKQHPGSNHVCYAYLIDPLNPRFRANDDGEPSSTAGKPILGQICSNNLSNILVAVVRYFGGTELGVSGLINAYKSAAEDVLNNAEIEEKQIMQKVKIQCSHVQFGNLMKYIKNEDFVFDAPVFGLHCVLTVDIPFLKVDEHVEQLTAIEDVSVIDEY